jgi:hypothetical protein
MSAGAGGGDARPATWQPATGFARSYHATAYVRGDQRTPRDGEDYSAVPRFDA